jgi:hypothetical protein
MAGPLTEELMKVLGLRLVHMITVLAACLAIGTTMVGCGDDTDSPSGGDGGQDGGAGTGGEDSAVPEKDSAVPAPDSAVPGDDAGDDAGSDAG